MELSNVQLLLIVNFLHYTASGLVLPALSKHILCNGGNHILLGFLCSLMFVSNALSKTIIGRFDLTNKQNVAVCLYSSFTTNLFLVLSNNPTLICLDRCLHALTNQVNWYAKEYVASTQAPIKYYNFLDLTKVVGMVLGAFSSGHIYDSGGFTVIAMSTTILTSLTIIALQYIKTDTPTPRKQQTQLLHLPQQWYHHLHNLRHVDFKSRSGPVTFLLIYIFTFTVFFSKHVYILNSSYHVSSTIIGYHVGYQFMLKFVSNAFVQLKGRSRNRRRLFHVSLAVCAYSLAALGPAPTLEVYWVFFVPLLTTYAVINSLLEEDILGLRGDRSLFEAVCTLKVVVKVVGPVVFGCLCEKFGRGAVWVLYVFPVATCVYLGWQWWGGNSTKEVDEGGKGKKE